MVVALLLLPIIRRRTVVIAALALSCCAPACVVANNVRDQRPHPSVARIIVPEGGATSFGSGTLIDVRDEFGLVITNWHVVRDARGPIEVLFPNGEQSKARALKVDADWDLAALVVWRPNVDPVALAATAPQPGDALTICGYGPGIYRAATGRCTGYYAPQLDMPQQMVELDVQARQGDSGGPIFNDRGELAGVLFGAGHGTTLGSFNGRVGSFLATLAPDIGTPPAADPANAQIVTNDPPDAKAEGLARVVTDGEREADDRFWDPPSGDLAAMWAESESENAQPPTKSAAQQAPPLPLASAWLGHAKTILAAVGVIAVVAQILRAAR